MNIEAFDKYAELFSDTMRWDVINALIKRYGFTTYLEIGVSKGELFTKVECEHKESVDPEDRGFTTNQMTSDEFFEYTPVSEKYDIIFVDGLHTADQCLKDMINARDHLTENGFIICHDMNPPTEFLARPYEQFLEDKTWWNGDVYKAFIDFRKLCPDFNGCLIEDCDWGLGVFRRGIGQRILCDTSTLTYNQWAHNKDYLMNCITVEEFMRIWC